MAYLGDGAQIPHIGKNEIVLRVKELLDECWDGSFPVNVEAVCDYLGIAIVSIDELFEKFCVDAFISADFKMIYVDQQEFEKESNRYRFSLAHELGHYVLHREYFSSRIEDFEEWQGFARGFTNDYVERQANFFAGSLLVPEMEMVRVFNRAFGGSLARNYWGVSLKEVRQILMRVRNYFKVSDEVVSRRMRDTFPGIGEVVR